MKNTNEMVNSLLERREHYEAEQKRKKNIIIRTVTSMCCFCFIALLGVGVWQSGLFNTTPPLTLDGNNAPLQETDKSNETKPNNNEASSVVPDASVIWGNSNDDMGYTEWNGKRITSSLHDVLSNEKNNNCLIAIDVGFELDKKFVYEGKTISEYEKAVDEAQRIIYKLGDMLESGDELKYGEALYKTGTPDGEKWSKELYDEKVARIGKDVLSTYIVNGEFLKEKLESDLAAYVAEDNSRENLDDAIDAYYEFIANETAKQLYERNINCEVREGLIVYVTVDEFSSLEIDNVLFYSLALKDDSVK